MPVISLDGDSTVRRCQFIRQPIGKLNEAGSEAVLYDRPRTNETCGCHIADVHLDHLALHGVFGAGSLERIAREVS